MSKPALYVALGNQLAKTRLAASMSQAEMARLVGCSIQLLQLAETGSVILNTFAVAAGKLGLSLGADALPRGKDVRQSLATMRSRLGISQDQLAHLVSIPLSAVCSLEAGENCWVADIAKVATTLGINLRLGRTGHTPGFYSCTSKMSLHQGWTTPPKFLARLYPVVDGMFDLDPCSPTTDAEDAPVAARDYFTAAQDGLSCAWTGKVFMNPPYNDALPAWVAKAGHEVEVGNAEVVFGLIPARTDTRWWHNSVADVADVWLIRGRLKFGGVGGGSAPFGSALVCWGLTAEMRAAVRAEFPQGDAWHVERTAS